jgi:hypothetical protein
MVNTLKTACHEKIEKKIRDKMKNKKEKQRPTTRSAQGKGLAGARQ